MNDVFSGKKELLEAALNPECCDLVVEGNLVNVLTGEIYEGCVGVKHGKIVYVGNEEIKNRNLIKTSYYVVPSFIDGHVHIESSMLPPSEFAKIAVLHGTCAVVADPHEIANVLGVSGIKFMLSDSRNLPVDFYFNVPSCVPSTEMFETSGEISAVEMKKLKKMDRIIGLGEVMNFPGVLNCDKKLAEKIRVFDSMVVDGHCPGLIGRKLNAYSVYCHSDHESTNYEEAVEKLRIGMWLMIREGSAAKNMSILKDIIRNGIDTRRCMIVTDDIHADDLSLGHLNLRLSKAVEIGADPVDAIRMTTLNTAEYFNLKNLGSISIGKDANISIVKDLKNFRVEKVFFKGKLASSNGNLTVKIKKTKTKFKNVMNVNKNFSFKIPAKEKTNTRVIKIIEGEIRTKEIIKEIKPKNNSLESNTAKDIIKISVIDRHKGINYSNAFVTGFGIKKGAIASTIAHDAHNIIVIGADDESMKKAVNELIRIHGGIAVAGEKIYSLPLPIAGLMSNNTKEVIQKLKVLNKEATKLGVKIHSPFMTLSFLALPVIPELKITDKGLVDVRKFKFTDLIIKNFN
ncbi:MAG: adenine deaminase [Candidatus Altiarchaeales archaeon IMC4]|nr:MAG: adenine deaminase [Candidatus Altiarchaeales archaeon IMC4]